VGNADADINGVRFAVLEVFSEYTKGPLPAHTRNCTS